MPADQRPGNLPMQELQQQVAEAIIVKVANR